MIYLNKCLCRKEKISIPDEINLWIQKEAVEQQHLPDYGTFREALIRCVEDKITPFLTSFLNEVDKCNNLITQRKYQQLWVELSEATVAIPSQDDDNIHFDSYECSRFPFSCQIIHMIETIVKTHMTTGKGGILKVYIFYSTKVQRH